MRKKPVVLMVFALALASSSLFAQTSPISDFYVIPVASHTAGANGSIWMSDIAIQNIQTTPINVQLVVIESGEGNSDNVFPLTNDTLNGSTTVPAGGSVLLKDILNNYRGRTSAIGSLLVGADQPFAVTSRSYVTLADGSMVGQTVTPATGFIENTIGRTDPTSRAFLPGLVSNAGFRTNIGFVVGNSSASGETMAVTVTIRNAAGAVIGTRLFAIGAGNFEHVQFSVASISTNQFDVGSAEFAITQGNGSVVPYASVVDNRTSDASFVLGQFPASTQLLSNPLMPSLMRQLFDRTRLLQ
jgi:hypothetical protein